MASCPACDISPASHQQERSWRLFHTLTWRWIPSNSLSLSICSGIELTGEVKALLPSTTDIWASTTSLHSQSLPSTDDSFECTRYKVLLARSTACWIFLVYMLLIGLYPSYSVEFSNFILYCGPFSQEYGDGSCWNSQLAHATSFVVWDNIYEGFLLTEPNMFVSAVWASSI